MPFRHLLNPCYRAISEKREENLFDSVSLIVFIPLICTYSELDPSKFGQNHNHKNKHQKPADKYFIHVLEHCLRADVSIAGK